MEIRKRLLADDLIDCVVYLPTQLFYTTPIAVSLWFLARQKAAPAERDRRGRTLFICAYRMGQMVNRTLRELTEDEIERIADTYRSWRGVRHTTAYRDIPGFCCEAAAETVAQHRYALVPGRYVGFPERALQPLDLAEVRQEITSLASRITEAGEELARASELIQELLPDGHPHV